MPRSSDEESSNGSVEKKKPEEQMPVGFWDSSLNAVRFEVCKMWLFTTLILMTAILAILSLYWGVLFRVQDNISALVVWVVDFDGQVAPYTDITPIVGPYITENALSRIAPKGAVGWGSLPPSDFHNDPLQVRQRIYDFDAWAAIIINPNATALLNEATQNGNTSYDPMGAAQIVFVQARDQQTISSYILPQIREFEQQVTSAFGEMWAERTLNQAAVNPNIYNSLRSTPQAISPAIGFTTYDLRPFSPADSLPAISIGLIYLIIIAFFSFSFYLPHHMKFIMSPGHPPLIFFQWIVWRWLATIVAYFFLSLAYSLISLSFQIPFSKPSGSEVDVVSPADAYHYGTFVVYWMLNWVGMTALGIACENVAMIIGQPWTSLWLIFWVITNVSTSFYSITLAPHFYYWGYAWPLHNIVEGSRQLLFDLHSRIGLNFGILFAWCAINTAIFPLACYFMRYMKKKEKEKEESKEE